MESHDHYVDEGIDDDEDDKTLKVYTIKKDVSLASYGKTFLLGIYGFFFSIVFHRNRLHRYLTACSSSATRCDSVCEMHKCFCFTL